MADYLERLRQKVGRSHSDIALTPVQELILQFTEYAVSLGRERAAKATPEELAPMYEAIAKKKRFEDGPKLISYLKTPEGDAFARETAERLWHEAELKQESAIKEVLLQQTEYIVSLGRKRAAKATPEELAPMYEAIAKKKGLEDGPKLMRYLRTPEGYAFARETTERLWHEAELREEARRRRPPVVVELTEEEKGRIIEDFKEIMGREPTEVEKSELFAEELKLKRRGVKT